MFYKYTPNEIADMTPVQQYEMLNLSDDEVRQTIQFDTIQEYETWLRARQ